MTPFNKPFISSRELEYISRAVASGHISGNGVFTKKCQEFFEDKYGIGKALLTTSCTDALEMAAILSGVGPGDEVIVPSYTFVSTALAFIRQGATLVYADSLPDHPDIDPASIEKLVTPRTKVIVPVHYAGMACDMDAIMDIARRHGLIVIEDAAQAIESSYKGRPLGSIGHMAAFSFHETKNVIAGEGGLLAVNAPEFAERAEIIWEKGTDRSKFFRGEIDKYGWVDTGSSFLPSELTAAFLWAQLESIDLIQERRWTLWNRYRDNLEVLQREGLALLPRLPEGASGNAHIFYLLLPDLDTRTRLTQWLKDHGVMAVFHYLSLHKSKYALDHTSGNASPLLPNSDRYTDTLLRLPLFHELTETEIDRICGLILGFLRCDKAGAL